MPDNIFIVMCEKNSLDRRLDSIREYKNIIPDESLVEIESESKGLGKYGTLKYGMVDDKTGYIEVKGFLNNNGPSRYDVVFGEDVTGYNDILDAIDIFDNLNINIDFFIDSPGGDVGIIDSVWQRIKGLNVNTRAVVSGMCCSAAYYMASACDEICSTGPASLLGSIGSMVITYDDSKFLENLGFERISIVSSNAEKKNLDPSTDEGKKELQSLVDSMEDRFIGRVSEGRNIEREKIISDFGQGGVLLAKEYTAKKLDALSVGMIDYVIDENKTGEEENIMPKKETNTTANIDNVGVSNLAPVDPSEIAAKAALEANSKNVQMILTRCSYNEEVRSIGFKVISGDADISEFHDAISSFERDELNEQVNESSNDEAINTGEKNRANGYNPTFVNSIDSMLANIKDFKRV